MRARATQERSTGESHFQGLIVFRPPPFPGPSSACFPMSLIMHEQLVDEWMGLRDGPERDAADQACRQLCSMAPAIVPLPCGASAERVQGGHRRSTRHPRPGSPTGCGCFLVAACKTSPATNDLPCAEHCRASCRAHSRGHSLGGRWPHFSYRRLRPWAGRAVCVRSVNVLWVLYAPGNKSWFW